MVARGPTAVNRRAAGRQTDGDDLAWQTRILPTVSRTYALTIPVLPAGLRERVENAYLLCRLADTIEDEPELPLPAKRRMWKRLVGLVEGGEGARSFASDLRRALSSATARGERELAANAARVLRITDRLGARHRAAVGRCLRIMCRGMDDFQRRASRAGLATLEQLDRYCYFAAGVVGEMLVDLFAGHSPGVARRRAELLALAVSHGQGLQMANILKDIAGDHARGACWLPRDVFEAEGFDLRDLQRGTDDPGFAAGLARLLAITRGHLDDALRFTQLIPKRQAGIRRHLLWGIGLAVLLLRRVHAAGSVPGRPTVRVSRVAVLAMVALTGVFARRDRFLRWLFRRATGPLPATIRSGPAATAVRA